MDMDAHGRARFVHEVHPYPEAGNPRRLRWGGSSGRERRGADFLTELLYPSHPSLVPRTDWSAAV